MPHNFRKYLAPAGTLYSRQPVLTTGANGNCCFVSKAGNDANNGLTPDTPKLTIGAAATIGKYHVFIGTGTYEENRLSGGECAFIADSAAIIRAKNDQDIKLTLFSGNNGSAGGFFAGYFDLTFEGFTSIYQDFGSNFNSMPMYRCRLDGINSLINGYITNDVPIQLIDCVLTNWSLSNPSTNQSFTLQNSLLFNCKLLGTGVSLITKTFLDANSDVVYRSTSTETSFQSNNINGRVNIGGAGLLDYAALPASYRTTSLSVPPNFNNAFAGDYTLRTSSQHLALGIGPSSLRFATSLFVQGPAGLVNESSGHFFFNESNGQSVPIIAATNLIATEQQGQLRLKVVEAPGGALTGVFRTGPIRVGNTPRELTRIGFAAGQNDNTDYPATEDFDANNPQTKNNNVPNSHNYVSGHAGRNPNRKEMVMRWSIKDDPQDNVVTDWITGANFLIFEWNERALYNPIHGRGLSIPVGNGSPEYLTAVETVAAGESANSPLPPQAQFVQFEITLMNSYYSR